MAKKTDIDGLSIEINALLEEYSADVAEDMKSEAKEVAKNAVKQLKANSPIGDGASKSGHYKDGWTSKVVSERSHAISITIHNKKKPWLTHLLENGHAKRGGGRVEGIPHIAPVEKEAIEEYKRRLKERLSQ